ncbi:hypothetical protein [Actinocorallia herbida]|uniref:hypothetical protein n=1 Tax=Actinocorallia herbida TaxID=58109 RepID=UPI0011CDC448|nr:hypothetical protein [Actinocorallia herbida]
MAGTRTVATRIALLAALGSPLAAVGLAAGMGADDRAASPVRPRGGNSGTGAQRPAPIVTPTKKRPKPRPMPDHVADPDRSSPLGGLLAPVGGLVSAVTQVVGSLPGPLASGEGGRFSPP